MDIFKINFKFWLVILMIVIIFIVVNALIIMFVKKEGMLKSLIWKSGILILFMPLYYYSVQYFMKIGFEDFIKYLWLPAYLFVIISMLYNELNNQNSNSKKQKRKNFIKETPFKFVLEVKGGKDIYFTEPFDNFLIYGGANSGKTKSLGRPLIGEYIRHRFAAFIFDYKDKDYTRVVFHLNQQQEDPLPFYYVNFVDLDYTYRTNIIKKEVIGSHAEMMQVIMDLFVALKSKDGKQDNWFAGAVGILKGVATRMFYDYPNLLTIPHLFLYCLNTDVLDIIAFCLKRPESATYIATLKSSMDSPKTMGSFMSSLHLGLADFASNKKICYVLSGDDFDFNLIDPEEPKLFAVSNSYQIESQIAPVISAMLSISSRKFTMENKVNFVYFLDEATTFKIPDFEKMPSVLREYLCSFVFITQSNSKVEKAYDRLDRSSIESNFANQFFGRTKDVKAAKDYVQMFSKIEEISYSYTRGKSTKSSSSSQTKSTRDKEKYFTDFFGKLPPGNFVGSANNSNYQEFDLQFEMFKVKEFEELPKVRSITEWDIDSNYTKILSQIKLLK